MAELTREQHQLLSGSALSTDSFFNGFIPSLNGRYMPGKAEQVNGNHYMSLINKDDSVMRLLANTFPGYVYKSDTDANNRFSVKPFTLPFRGLDYTYAGATGLGPLSTGVNCIWGDLLATSTAISIALGASFPTTPHVPLAEINMPASGHWLPDQLTPRANRRALWMPGGNRIRQQFTFANTGTTNVCLVPAGAVIFKTELWVSTLFNGTTPTLTVGDAGDADRLGQTGDFTLTSAGPYTANRPHQYGSQTMITKTLSIAGGGPSQGVAHLFIDYTL